MTNKPSDDLWNTRETHERDALALELIRHAWARLENAEQQLGGPYMEVELGSSLQIDSRYLGPWGTGSLHRSALSSSADALRSIRFFFDRDAPVLPMTGLYPVLRTAIESAALAVYLLGPDQRNIRLSRSIREAAGEAEMEYKFSAQFDEERATRSRDSWRNDIAELLRARPEVESHLPKPSSETITNILREADRVNRADPAAHLAAKRMPLLATWQLLSGLAHGKQWAMMTALVRSEAVVADDGDTAHVKLTSQTAMVAVPLLSALDVLECGLRLYGRRARFWARMPEDADEASAP